MAGDRLYKKKDGTVWYGYFYDLEGKRRVVCTKQQDRAAARAVLREAEREANAAPGLSKARGEAGHTVGDALQYLLDHGCHDVAPATSTMHAQKAGHLLRLLGERDVGKLTLEMVQDYVQARLEENAHRESVRKELCTLRRALQIAHDRKLLRTDPRGLIPRMRVRYTPKDRYLSEQEFALLLAALPAHRRLWVAFAVYTGARASEVEAVCWEHVDLVRGQILILGTKTEKARRRVAIAAALRVLLEGVDEERRVGSVVEPWGNVRRDLAEAIDRANRKLQKEAVEAGARPPEPMRKVSPNDLRRTFASWLKQRGVDSMVVAKLLGHTTSRMVELVYGHLNDATTQAAVAQLPAMAPTVAELPPAPEPAPITSLDAWRRRGARPAAKSAVAEIGEAPDAGDRGSKWVAEQERPERRERLQRRGRRESFPQVLVPSPGIEPGTRGFSVRCSTS